MPVMVLGESGETAELLSADLQQVNDLYAQGKKQASLELLNSIVARAEDAEGEARTIQLRAHLMLADYHGRAGNFIQYAAVLGRLLDHLKSWDILETPESVLVQQRLAQAYVQLGREQRALQTYVSALALAHQVYSPGDLRLVDIHIPLARLYVTRLEIDKAQGYLDAADDILDAVNNTSGHILKGRVLQTRGELAFRLTKNRASLKLYQEALALREKVLGKDSLETGQTVVSLASTYKALHRFSEAEEHYRRGFFIYEQSLGIAHPYVATLLNNLGQLYYLQGRYEESEKALLKAIEIKSKSYDANHIALADSYNHLGYLYYLLERDEQALKHLAEAIRIWSLPDSKRPRYAASATMWTAAIKHRQGQPQQSLDELNNNLKILEEIFGKNTIATSELYHELGEVYRTLDKPLKAEAAYLEGLKSAGQYGQGDWLDTIRINARLADLYLEEGDMQQALDRARKAIEGLKLRTLRHSGLRAQSLTAELKSLKEVVISHVDVLYALIQSGVDKDSLLNESFLSAQLSRATSAAQALSRMARRFSLGEGELADMVGQREDLLEQWQEIDDLLSAALLKPGAERDIALEQRLAKSADGIHKDIRQLDRSIERKFPDYANLSMPLPVTIKQVQSLLHQDETMLVYLFGKHKGYLWTISDQGAELVKLDITEGQLEQQVRRLRRRLAPQGEVRIGSIAPLPVPQAHRLYKLLIEPGGPLIDKSKHLIAIADSALQSLPLSVLVRSLPKKPVRRPEEHRNVDWLIKDRAISTLPAVSSLSVLRTMEAPGNQGRHPFLGIGDPALKEMLGDKGQPSRYPKNTEAASLRSIIGAKRAAVDVEVLMTLPELPETANELRQVSKLLEGREEDIYLRDHATESELRSLQTNHFKIIQFATHGLMAGDFQGLFEPSLVLTPRSNPGDPGNDGLLTASEITQLQFNADMVVLSACNTAAPDGAPGAEGLSGLGRAFFYAGARTLLLSHWEVASEATVEITTGMFRAMKDTPEIGKAEAHRRSVLALMNKSDKPYYAHPMFWAPFTIVGEGGG